MIFNDQNVTIPDCSFWQDDDGTLRKIDFSKMKSAGANGVILRAGQNSWLDEDFSDYWISAKQTGLPRGSYWFFDSRYDPVKQAQLWWSVIQNDFPELGMWADLEETYNGSYKGERNWKTFVLTIEALAKTECGIYTANWWWQAQQVADPTFWGSRRLWIAQYTDNPSLVEIPFPWRNKKALFWQYTASGNGVKYGVESLEIDLNKWNGTKSEFESFFNLSETPPTGEPMPYIELKSNIPTEYRSVRGDTNYPTTPHIFGSTSVANRILSGTAGKADPISFYVYPADISVNGVLSAKAGDKWWEIYESGGVPMEGWVAETHKGVRYLNVNLVDTTPTPDVTLTHTILVYSDGSLVVDGNPIP